MYQKEIGRRHLLLSKQVLVFIQADQMLIDANLQETVSFFFLLMLIIIMLLLSKLNTFCRIIRVI